MNEDQYWRDFAAGRSLKKYGVKTVKQWHIDKFAVEEILVNRVPQIRKKKNEARRSG